MKIILNNAISIFNILLNIDTNSFKVNYWVFKNVKIFSDTNTFFIQERNKLYEKYCIRKDDGSYFTELENNILKPNFKNSESEQKFNTSFDKLLNTDCEITPFMIDLKTLMDSNITLTPAQIFVIEKLFTSPIE